MILLLAGLSGAVAQDADEAEAEEADATEEAAEEVVVYGELRVEQARRAVIEELEDAGYDHEVLDLGDRVVYRHAAPWKGEVVLFDDGFAEVRRQPLHAEGVGMPWAKKNSPLAWAGCLIWPWACIRYYGATVSDRKWRATETRPVQRVAPKVRDWGDRIADLSIDRKVEGLPDMLEALWLEGRPLSGRGDALATYRERRAALLAFYGSRTDTTWGRQVQGAVMGFVRAVVQRSDHPFTEAEVAAAAAAGTPLELGPQRP